MATIKAIEAKSVHQIQSGQVIVDLCSVVKELVENSLDAGASSIEVRFKNNGLEAIEVQDNGSGISSANYESLALKHHTSKLSSYEDLSSLHTFGFRGEALSSLCALSTFYVTTAQADEAPKGTRLDFESSGRLKATSIVACQKGTTAFVEGLFEQLPVRRKELSKNIKREYGKAIGILHAYACISTDVKFIVKNAMPKSKGVVVFAIKSNTTTRENIANIYGAKTLSALVALDLDLDSQPTLTHISGNDAHTTNIKIRGHISRPVFGEGRQTPDRQMFFVNGRPCGLPQIAKAINEVYKTFNVSQSPFIFADFQMDTNAYDVNVSPDKRTILLHNAANLIEKLKSSLTEMFDKQEQTVPQSQLQKSKLPSFKQLNVQRLGSIDSNGSARSRHLSKTPDSAEHHDLSEHSSADDDETPYRLPYENFRARASTRREPTSRPAKVNEEKLHKQHEKRTEKPAEVLAKQPEAMKGRDEDGDVQEMQEHGVWSRHEEEGALNVHVRDFNERMAEQQKRQGNKDEESNDTSAEEERPSATSQPSGEHLNLVQNAFDRMRPKRTKAEIATITIGDKTITTVVGTQLPKTPAAKPGQKLNYLSGSGLTQRFSQGLRKFGAPGTQDLPSKGAGESPKEDISDSEAEAVDESPDDEESRPRIDRLAENRGSDPLSDSEYLDEADKKAKEDAMVADLIRAAEESAAVPSEENIRRANNALKSGGVRNSTKRLCTTLTVDPGELKEPLRSLRKLATITRQSERLTNSVDEVQSEEQRLSLTVSKDDFPNMHIVGQFNLGFIIAVRPATHSNEAEIPTSGRDELFIIDQHASDEKFNFERLQTEIVVGNQRVVRPMTLELTAVEEEIVLENMEALEKNGFVVEADKSGDSPVGQRIKLLSLPLSKEVVFDTRDLEELIHLLAEWPSLAISDTVPRPTKVRKMFAMRACRSSIMVGKSLSTKQMSTVLTHMGTIDKPWNCPHGRPTMRHLTGLDALDLWREGDGISASSADGGYQPERSIWKNYLA